MHILFPVHIIDHKQSAYEESFDKCPTDLWSFAGFKIGLRRLVMGLKFRLDIGTHARDYQHLTIKIVG